MSKTITFEVTLKKKFLWFEYDVKRMRHVRLLIPPELRRYVRKEQTIFCQDYPKIKKRNNIYIYDESLGGFQYDNDVLDFLSKNYKKIKCMKAISIENKWDFIEGQNMDIGGIVYECIPIFKNKN